MNALPAPNSAIWGFSGISDPLTVRAFPFAPSKRQRSTLLPRRGTRRERSAPPRPTNSACRESAPYAPRPPQRSARTAQARRQSPAPRPAACGAGRETAAAPSTNTPICASLRSHMCGPASDAPGKNRASQRVIVMLRNTVCSPF